MRTVLVTGASKGIGQAIAIELAKAGFYIVIHYNQDREGALSTLKQIESNSGQARLIQFDVSERAVCQAVIEDDIAQFGAYYGVINNAGIIRDGAFPALTGEDWEDVIHTNLDSFYNVIHPCIMPMIGLRQGGRIIVLSSVSGITGNRGQVNYSASKAGLIGATKALAIELGKRKITVNCVAPGLIDTGIVDINPIAMEETMKMIPLKRMGEVNEVAYLVNFLMSDKANYITRQVISINGGMV